MHVNNACGHTFAGAVTGAPPETHSSEGGGVWAEYLPKAALTSNTLFLDDANVLVPVWLGGRGDRPAFPIGRNRIFFYVVKSPWIKFMVPPISDWLTPDETVAHIPAKSFGKERGGKRVNRGSK